MPIFGCFGAVLELSMKRAEARLKLKGSGSGSDPNVILTANAVHGLVAREVDSGLFKSAVEKELKHYILTAEPGNFVVSVGTLRASATRDNDTGSIKVLTVVDKSEIPEVIS
jgi:hypothetical protein